MYVIEVSTLYVFDDKPTIAYYKDSLTLTTDISEAKKFKGKKEVDIVASKLSKSKSRTVKVIDVCTMELKILKGNFIEGERVTVSINGDIITRVVRYDSQAGDLSIVYKNKRYFYYEFY